MNIILNGQPKQVADAANLQAIVEQFCRNTRHVIAEVNGTIVKSQQWVDKTLLEGDAIELVNLVGGG